MTLTVALHNQPQQTQALFMKAFGVGTSVGFLLPYSRLHESDADRIGLTLMARAGYDPRAAIPFWKRMQTQEKLDSRNFFQPIRHRRSASGTFRPTWPRH